MTGVRYIVWYPSAVLRTGFPGSFPVEATYRQINDNKCALSDGISCLCGKLCEFPWQKSCTMRVIWNLPMVEAETEKSHSAGSTLNMLGTY